MARPGIIDKLRSELHLPVETEMQVVYILVEIRKVLEHNTEKGRYPVLNFYCNWIVHTKLSASPVADRIVRLLDETLYRLANGERDVALEAQAEEFMDERLLRDELRAFLESSDLPLEICTDSGRWDAFRKRLAGVIEDVPLKLLPSKASDPTHFVESVIVKNKSTEDALHVEWGLVTHSNPIIKIKNSKIKLIGKRPIKP